MPIPDLSESDDFDKNEFPHFAVFCGMQLAVPMGPGDHWENAKVVAAIPEQEIRTVTPQILWDRGFISK